MCRALGARRVVEVGASFGVSTLYLADAVRANGGGVVIATEHEPAKAAAAHANFVEAGLAEFIDLREGDLREILKVIEGPMNLGPSRLGSPDRLFGRPEEDASGVDQHVLPPSTTNV
jgi:predicted O-methyltransferase YrrM